MSSRVETVPIHDTMLSEMCPDVAASTSASASSASATASFCFPHKYRTANGECNNVKQPMWGVTGAAYLRLAPAQYDDGVGTPRTKASTAPLLPDALAVSSRLIWTQDIPHEHLTAAAAIWGELVANDIRLN